MPSEALGCLEKAKAQEANLQKRARAKYFSHELAWRLTKLRGELEQSYLNTVYCAGTIVQEAGEMRSRYCGNRWCLVCNRIRIARAITAYLPVLEEWEDPQLVTVTLRNCSGDALEETIDRMLKDFTSIKRSIKRTEGLPFKALRKLECTYNQVQDSYHPHFHIVVEGREAAEAFVEKWLGKHRESASPAGQDIRPCDAKALKELFKYFTKLVSKVRRKGGEERSVMPATALDTIFLAMRRRRVYQPVGFQISLSDDEKIEGEDDLGTRSSAAVKRLTESVMWIWEQDVSDWIDHETGECLSGYEPSDGYRTFVASIDGHSPVAGAPDTSSASLGSVDASVSAGFSLPTDFATGLSGIASDQDSASSGQEKRSSANDRACNQFSEATSHL